MQDTIYLVKVTAKAVPDDADYFKTRPYHWHDEIYLSAKHAGEVAESLVDDTYYTRVYRIGDQLSLVKQYGSPKRKPQPPREKPLPEPTPFGSPAFIGPKWPLGGSWTGGLGVGYRDEFNCAHGTGHGPHIHGCDGCCRRPDYPYNKEDLRRQYRVKNPRSV
jgi:hypothetical protein